MRGESAFGVFSKLAGLIRKTVGRLAGVFGRSPELAEKTRAELLAREPRLVAALADAQVLAYLNAAREIMTIPAVRVAVARPVLARPIFAKRPRPAELSPIFPQLERAADWLADRMPFTPEDYDQLTDEARRVSFTVARAQSLDAVKTVQRVLADDVRQGGTLGEFRERVAEALDGSAIGDGQVEALYRTHVGRAYSAGQVETLDDPAVRSAVPYLLYSATHDSRVRPEHLALESLGLDGTAVYRADDPVWDRFYPPWAWNCRCVVIALGIDEAAELGVKEAIQWKRTGRPPAVPQFVKPFPFDIPPGWVPTGRRLSPLV